MEKKTWQNCVLQWVSDLSKNVIQIIQNPQNLNFQHLQKNLWIIYLVGSALTLLDGLLWIIWNKSKKAYYWGRSAQKTIKCHILYHQLPKQLTKTNKNTIIPPKITPVHDCNGRIGMQMWNLIFILEPNVEFLKV